MNPFCEPVTAMSTPHSSIRKSMDAMELTPSTKRSAGWRASSSALRTPAISLVTPVAVSLCTTATALIRCCRSAWRISWNRSTGAPSPHSTSTTSTSIPCRCIRSIHKWENWPNRADSTRSPGERVFVMAASQPPVPLAGKMNGWPSRVLNTLRRSRNSPVGSSGNLLER